MYMLIGLGIVCLTIYAIVHEVYDYLKKKDKETEWYKWAETRY